MQGFNEGQTRVSANLLGIERTGTVLSVNTYGYRVGVQVVWDYLPPNYNSYQGWYDEMELEIITP